MLRTVLKQLFRPRAEPVSAVQQASAGVERLLRQAIARQQRGELHDADALYVEALRQDPAHVDVLHLLGHVRAQQGRDAEAADILQRAVRHSAQPEIYLSLGNAYSAQGRPQEAIRAYEHAVDLRPDFAAAWNNLANMHRSAGDYESAERCYRKSTALDPTVLNGRLELGNMVFHQGRLDEAIQLYRDVLDANPRFAGAHSALIYALNFHPGYAPEAVYAEHRRWGEAHADPLTHASAAAAIDRTPGRPLRVGYVSPNFWDHAVAYFFEPTLRHHDRAAFEVICYSDGERSDAYTERLKNCGTAAWKSTRALTDDAFARLVREDRVDILVDLTGHINDNRLLMFARRPAPVQATWNGYANTTGMLAMDYRITDAYADPPGTTEHLHTERLARLPEIYMAFQPPEPAPPVSSLPMLSAGHVTFGSFNAAHKITPQVVRVWASVLRSLPMSRLLLATVPEGRMRRDLTEAFATHGVRGQLEFHNRLPKQQFLELHGCVDVALDPFPFHGTTTTCCTLWMGVPLVTLAGRSHVSRVGVSMLANLGLHDLVAKDEADYVDIAVALARDADRLAALRSGLRERMRTSPNTDGARLTRHLEAAYVQMWNDRCSSTS